MVASKRPARPEFVLIIASLSALMAISACDMFSSALPQGYANDLVSYADPRWEDRVRIEDSQFYGVAVENSDPSPRVFVIGRTAVAEYDADLKLVRRYRPTNVFDMETFTDGHGPEQWDAQIMSASVVRLYGAWSGMTLYLFSPGDTVLTRRFYAGKKLYSFMLNTTNFDEPQQDFTYDGITLSWGSSAAITNARAYYVDIPSNQVHVLTSLSATPAGKGFTSHVLNVQVFQLADGTLADTSVSLTTPPVEDWLSFDRLTVQGTRIIVTFANQTGELQDYESASFLYERFGSGQPLSSFRSNAAAVDSTADSLYVLAAAREGEAWLHRMRWLP